MKSNPPARKVAFCLILGLMAGACASITVLMLCAPFAIAGMGAHKGEYNYALAVLATPWWTRFVVGYVYRCGVLTAMSGGFIQPPTADRPS
ncbi:MAG: hypothetical protein DDT34_01929 [Firmicutes bacterium]|nr:hypothetical protein [Bacillota bacterium]MBT9165799.1 hypothetical protein [Chloroflexota bacterium]